MANTAFRRDPSDEKVVLGFARQVGTPEALKMLYVLTAADIAAVGPGVMTPWKETLLGELFSKTLLELTGDEETAGETGTLPQKEHVRQALIQRLGARIPTEWLNKQLDAWPERYLQALPVARIATHLEWVARLADMSVLVDANHEPSWGTTEYTVYTRDTLTPGIISKIAGVLASRGVQILDAQILTLADGVVVDAFRVLDQDFPEGPTPSRISDICNAISSVLMDRARVEDLLQEASRFGEGRQGVPLREPTVVQVDNDTSDRYTIIDVFADDRQGLLYVITRAIFDLDLSVHSSRISTKLDQVVDVFYVSDRAGAKVQDAGQCEIIRETIAKRIEEFLCGGRAVRPVVYRGNGQPH
jgi:[protein-PII] uridylyltransferase